MSQSKMQVTDDTEKKFVMKHVFKDVKNLLVDKRPGAEMSGPVEEHFVVKWKLRIVNMNNDFIDLHLDCLETENPCDWSIETDSRVFLDDAPFPAQNFDFHSKNRLVKDATAWLSKIVYSEFTTNNGNMPVEFRVTITKMTGFKKEKLRRFDDEEAKECSDMVLKIGDQKLYVSKLSLAFHSTYFKSLFLGNFSESQKAEVELKDINPEHFQNFLELINGDSFVDDDTVEGILNLADFFDSKTALRRCDEFLLNRSKLPLKVKFNAAIKYQLDELKVYHRTN